MWFIIDFQPEDKIVTKFTDTYADRLSDDDVGIFVQENQRLVLRGLKVRTMAYPLQICGFFCFEVSDVGK